MTTPEERIIAMGMSMPAVPVPLAAYVPAARSGSLVFTAGQLPFVEGKLALTGIVGAGVEPDDAKAMARICALNAVAAVKAEIGELSRVVRVVKVVGFVASTADFGGHPAVVNGASEFLGEVFGDAGIHARSAVGVASLPMNAPVEVEIIVEVE